jgi:phospholipase C
MRTKITAALAVLAMTLPLAGSGARASSIPIDHVVVLMQENRSYFNYLAMLHDQGQPDAAALPADASNPNPTNPSAPAIKPFHDTSYCESADLDHSWTGAHAEYDGGKMDGFTARNVDATDPTGKRAMGYYDQTDLPYYYKLFNTYATSDSYFSSLLGPTYPNRFYLLAGTSFGHIQNDLSGTDTFTQPSVFNLLDAAHVTWKVYFTEISFALLFKYVRDNAAGHLFPISQYFADAAAGNLPQVSYVDPGFFGTRNTESDEHPSANIQTGEKFSSQVVGALTSSPNWSRSALFLTYDEDGGFYDNVPPPPAPIPDGIAPMLQSGDTPAAFDRYGFRVPVVVVSPYSKAHSVSHVVNDHTSILKFIETRFGLPSLTNRDAQANPMLEFFDFSSPAFATPPAMPDAPIDAAHAQECQQNEALPSGVPDM